MADREQESEECKAENLFHSIEYKIQLIIKYAR